MKIVLHGSAALRAWRSARVKYSNLLLTRVLLVFQRSSAYSVWNLQSYIPINANSLMSMYKNFIKLKYHPHSSLVLAHCPRKRSFHEQSFMHFGL
ncbi:hypothetical protein ACOSP7_010850 [Xanthoceras sorbifolium]